MSNLANPLLYAVEKYDTTPAFIYGNKIISYGEYANQINNLIINLTNLGVNPKMRVAFVSENKYQEILLVLSLIYIGAVACPLSNRYPKEMLSKIVKALKPEFNLSLQDNNIYNNIENPSDNLNKIKDINPDDDATIIFTSGTSDLPKGVVHSFANHYYSALGSNENIKLVPGDRWLLSLPLYHVGGLAIVFRTLLSGATLVIPDANEPLEDSILKYYPTHLSLVSTQFKKLLDSKTNLTDFKAILIGGGSVPLTLIKKGRDFNLPIYTSYGLTEMASQVTTTQPDDSFEKLSTSGKLLNYKDLKINNANEILVKGNTLFKKYIDNQNPFDNDGWFHTRDLGAIDKTGYLSVFGRIDNMFISGGENIHPEQIENLLNQIENIEDTIVVPIDDTEFGQRPVAFIKSNNPDFNYDSINLQIEKFKRPLKYFKWPDDYVQHGIKPDRKYFINIAKKLSK